MALILLVDDEPDMRELIAEDLSAGGHQVLEARDAAHALSLLQEHQPDLIVSDVVMPGRDGFEFCALVRQQPQLAFTPFVFVTGRSDMTDKYRGLFVGADDYITKPFETSDLIARIEGRLEHRAHTLALRKQHEESAALLESTDDVETLRTQKRALSEANAALYEAGHWHLPPPSTARSSAHDRLSKLEARHPALAEFRRQHMVGATPAFVAIFEDILIASSHDDATLVLGETGTGKTAVAEGIRKLSRRSKGPFVTLNCAELSAADPTIVLGKLFGYGRNTGLPNIPAKGQPGLLEEADGGVLFLDEFSLLPPQAQTMLLLPLEGRPFHPAVGSAEPKTVSVKFVLATNRDLAAEVADGQFPRDVYERVANDSIFIPPLRDRKADIPSLTERFLQEVASDEDLSCTLAPQTFEVFQAYQWPGNVRELRRIIRGAARRAGLRGSPCTITPEDLPQELALQGPAPDRRNDTLPALSSHEPPKRGVFTPREESELQALRATSFNVGKAECLLGYSSGSRTLSHRLHGICLKALALHGGAVELATQLLTGPSDDLRPIVTRRLQQLIERFQGQLAEGKSPSLKHIQAEHKPYADQVIKQLSASP